jgi:glucose/arabinose dehydrogenase
MSSERSRCRWALVAACSIGPAVSGCSVEFGTAQSSADGSDGVAADGSESDAANGTVDRDAFGFRTDPVAPRANGSTDSNGLLRPHGAGDGTGPGREPLPHSAGDYMLPELTLPPGFDIGILAQDLPGAGMLAVHQEHVYVTRPAYGDVIRLDDSDQDGFAEWRQTVVTDLPNVQAIAFKYDQVFLATHERVYRGRVNTLGKFEPVTPIIDQLPTCDGQAYRGLGVGPDLSLYVSADCSSQSAPEGGELLRFALDGSTRNVFARGLRKTVGFGWHPESGELWGMDPSFDRPNSASWPDELNKIAEGGDYGSPYCYADGEVDPDATEPPESNKPDYCAGTLPSVLDYVERGSAKGMVFYTGNAFPPEYEGDAFVALHGSWDSRSPVGYKVIRIRFRDGVPVGFENFVTGFLMEGAFSFGRPHGIAVAEDGGLVFSDDQNGVVYRVTYRG